MDSNAANVEARMKRIKDCIGNWPDFPKNGIIFRDIFPLTKNAAVFADCISVMVEHVQSSCGQVDAIVGLESRGFIFAPLIAQRLGLAFVPVRKSGKLPGPTVKAVYSLEYGQDEFEVQKDALEAGQRVVIVDDLLATGGTMAAAHSLITSIGAEVAECLVVIELADLKGRDKVPGTVKSLLSYEGD